MSKFIYNCIRHVKATNLFALPSHNLYPLLSNPFSSSSLKEIKNSTISSSYTVDYLINSCGLAPEKAIRAAKSVNFETRDKPDSVLVFFRNHGFSKAQILYLTDNLPNVLLCNPQKTLLPKIEFLKSKGASCADVAEILSRSPRIFKRSLEKHIIPNFDLYTNLVQSEKRTIVAIKRFGGVLSFDLETYLVPNIEFLKTSGVSDNNIEYYLRHNPRTLMTPRDKFKQIVEQVKKMGFDTSKLMFLSAVHALRSMKKSTWDKKVEIYKKWGWSDDDIVDAFRKNSWCMTCSESKINSVMGFWVDTMGWESSFLAHRPILIGFSLEKRMVPRCQVYNALLSKGLIKPGSISLTRMIECPEEHFLEKFINRYEKEADELLKLYKEKMGLEK